MESNQIDEKNILIEIKNQKKYNNIKDNQKRDLILNNFNYKINDILDVDQNRISNLLTDFIDGIKKLINLNKKKELVVLNDLNLTFRSGTSTIVFFIN